MSTALLVINEPKKEKWCRYCQKWIGVQGYDAHIHFKHLNEYLSDFRFTTRRLLGPEEYDKMRQG
jgi:hypothetical protein